MKWIISVRSTLRLFLPPFFVFFGFASTEKSRKTQGIAEGSWLQGW